MSFNIVPADQEKLDAWLKSHNQDCPAKGKPLTFNFTLRKALDYAIKATCACGAKVILAD